MTSEVLDQSQDVSGRELHRLTTIYSPPDFVKSASVERLFGDPDSQPRHTYADQLHKCYPTHSAPATWVSTLFFLDKQAQYDSKIAAEISSRLQQAAKYYAIESHVRDLHEKVAAHVADAMAELVDDDYAIVWTNGEIKERRYPLRNSAEVKTAAAYFAKYANDFTFEDRNRIAIRLLDKANAHGTDLTKYSEQLEKSAGWGVCTAKDASDALEIRSDLLRPHFPGYSTELRKLAGILRDHAEQTHNPEALYKLANVVDQLDRTTGLHRDVTSGKIPAVEDVFFPLTQKITRAFVTQHVTTITGNVYPCADMEKLGYSDVQDWLGDDFVQAVSGNGLMLDMAKMADVVPTLDRDTARMFDRMMANARIQPVMHEKAANAAPLAGKGLLEYALKHQAGN